MQRVTAVVTLEDDLLAAQLSDGKTFLSADAVA